MRALFPCSVASRLLFGAVAALMLSSCAQKLTSANDVRKLPISRGLNGGSYVAESPWRYLRTTRNYYVFEYYHNVDNLLYQREIHIPRGVATLHFPEFLLTQGSQWATLRQEGDKLHFYAHHPREKAGGNRGADRMGLL